MRTKWILALWIAVIILVGGTIAVVNSFRNEDAVRVIADTVKLEKPASDAAVTTCILRLINAGVIHGRVKHGAPFNVWGRRFEVTQTGTSVTCRSPGIFRIGGAEATQQ